jgi:hypothetical protein
MGRAGGVPGHWVGGHDIWLVSVHEFTMDSQLLTVGGFPRRFNDDFTLGGTVLVLSLAHMARTATGWFGRGIWSYLHQPVLDHGLDSLVFCGSRAQDFLVPPDFGRRASRYLFFSSFFREGVQHEWRFYFPWMESQETRLRTAPETRRVRWDGTSARVLSHVRAKLYRVYATKIGNGYLDSGYTGCLLCLMVPGICREDKSWTGCLVAIDGIGES